jgi:hypothetical protein
MFVCSLSTGLKFPPGTTKMSRRGGKAGSNHKPQNEGADSVTVYTIFGWATASSIKLWLRQPSLPLQELHKKLTVAHVKRGTHQDFWRCGCLIFRDSIHGLYQHLLEIAKICSSINLPNEQVMKEQ